MQRGGQDEVLSRRSLMLLAFWVHLGHPDQAVTICPETSILELEGPQTPTDPSPPHVRRAANQQEGTTSSGHQQKGGRASRTGVLTTCPERLLLLD